jgi:hypothetical protein
MVDFTKFIQRYHADRNFEVKAHESIERLPACKHISNGNLGLFCPTGIRDSNEREVLAIRKALEIVASCSVSQQMMFHGLTRTGKAGHGVCGPSSTPSASCQRS